MTQRAEGNLIGALKKKSNLTSKQARNIVFITAITFGLKEENQESDVIISVVHRKLSRSYLERLAVY